MSPEPHPPPLHRSLAARLRSWFFTGLVVFAPAAMTAYIVWWVVNTVDNWVKPLLPGRVLPDSRRHEVPDCRRRRSKEKALGCPGCNLRVEQEIDKPHG